ECKPAKPAPQAESDEDAERLFRESLRLCGLPRTDDMDELLDKISVEMSAAAAEMAANQVHSGISSSKANAYYLPELYEHLEVILSYYLCWTNIMDSTDNFNVVSSCNADTQERKTGEPIGTLPSSTHNARCASRS
ncbi:unnamed protein product, partial [Trichogramma brassicae]